MAAPVASYVQLPSDTGNSGKKLRTQTRVVGANTVHEHVVVFTSPRRITGLFHCTFALYTVAATAQNGTTAAICWLTNPNNSSINARLRYVNVSHTNNVATAIDHLTVPRIAVQRGVHSGTWTGAVNNMADRLTTENPQVQPYTASTGAAVTLLATQLIWASMVPGVDVTTAGVYNSQFAEEWKPNFEEEFVEIAPGELIAIYQIDAGTTSDQRKALVRICWDEVDITPIGN
jgi:hypothetical protein